MLEKIMLTDKEYENLAKGIAIGVGVGIIIGTIFDNTVLFFAAGGVLGIVSSLIYSKIKEYKEHHI
ncbi:hypothetical protein [Clostridium taeniosporum]|uniref:Uncharacterized protein n=1 Tax=Clostridium taeniosporum TaxID=394958 RepID=A0A1D7XMV9_9CLOT|nr:hypothetical protein [Clostridium taeniosporum]AOR24693.1 hypothetical protein BGI42_13495 [Clostridium taeniosporum]